MGISKLAIIFVIGSFPEPSFFSLVKLLKMTITTTKKRRMKTVKKVKRKRTIQISIPQKSNLDKVYRSVSNNRYDSFTVRRRKKSYLQRTFRRSLHFDVSGNGS